jgi:hypothetical protein
MKFPGLHAYSQGESLNGAYALIQRFSLSVFYSLPEDRAALIYYVTTVSLIANEFVEYVRT